MTGTQLEDEKLRQDILNAERQRSLIGRIGPWAAAIVAVGGVLLTWRKQIDDAHHQQDEDRRAREEAQKQEARQRVLDRQQQAAALAQQKSAAEQRLEEAFTSIAMNLGSASSSVQASAAASLLPFLSPDRRQFHEQLFFLVLANLKVKHDPEVLKLLVRVFERALPLMLSSKSLDRTLVLDLTHVHLQTANLAGLDLTEADVAFADLRYGNLRNACLRRLQGYQVKLGKAHLSGADTDLGEARLRQALCVETQFHDANLVSARLEEADLTGAQFQRAKLQSAHLDETILERTSFEDADISDAFFRRLQRIDTESKRSLSRAKKWRKAHFDDDVHADIERLSGDGKDL